MNTNELIPNLFRTEYSKLVAVLCSVFGMSNMQLAEDIVSETFLLASETWSKKGIPDNQVGWLHTVAKNKTRDHFRRQKIKRDKVDPDVAYMTETSTEQAFDFNDEGIQDGQLKMIFAICHPSIKEDAQIALALRILCGFGIDEIVAALLSNKESINKKLYRAKQKLKDQQVKFEMPPEDAIEERLDTALKTIYLLFSEGYYSANIQETIRKDLCLEAMRLNLLLCNNEATNLPKVNALLALMCFHASRLEARLTPDGQFVLYDDQDRSLWNQSLITQGEFYLNRASIGENLSKYHLEAAIAYWHTQEDSSEKWEKILQLYNYLLQTEYSPIAALNRTYALSKARSKKEALKEAKKLDLTKSHLYFSLLAELEASIKGQLGYLEKAISLTQSDEEKRVLQGKLDQLKNRD